MKIYFTALLIVCRSLAPSTAFSIPSPRTCKHIHPTLRNGISIPKRTTSSLAMDFESDFASAMPAKVEKSVQEKMRDSATIFIADLRSRLAEGVPEPPELEDLIQARDNNASAEELALKIYILLIEQGMRYDQSPEDGSMTETDFDIPNNLDIPEVKKEFAYLYKYGMNLIAKGLVEMEDVKEVVQERLIKRTGLTPEKFDEWLGY